MIARSKRSNSRGDDAGRHVKAKSQRVQVVDFFSGCGGMSYGFKTARTRNIRFDVLGGVDVDRHANATFQRMLGREPLCADVEDLLRKGALEKTLSQWGVSRSEPLLVIGCAPCQGFSSHQKRYSKTDVRNKLLLTFGKILVRLRPDIAVMENVPEILYEQYWEHFAQWRKIMTSAGYTVRVKIYNMAQFGVPQERFRVLVVAARDWPHFRMPVPTHRPDQFVTVRQAIGHLPPLEAGGVAPDDPMHMTSRHRPETVELLKLIPPDGGGKRDLPSGAGPDCLRVDGFRDVYGRMRWDLPANSITTRCRTPSAGRYAHPEQHRGLSVREASLLQGFPPEYYFEGPFDDKFKQIGNAVSPIFARAVATHLGKEWVADHAQPVDTSGDITEAIRKSFSSSIASLKRHMRENESDADVGALLGTV